MSEKIIFKKRVTIDNMYLQGHDFHLLQGPLHWKVVDLPIN